jgi:hypothetical protein
MGEVKFIRLLNHSNTTAPILHAVKVIEGVKGIKITFQILVHADIYIRLRHSTTSASIISHLQDGFTALLVGGYYQT